MAKNSFSSFDKDISMELGQDEELLLRCAPQKASFVLSKSITLLPIAIIWLIFDGFAISMITKSGVPSEMRIFLLLFFAIHLLPVWLWIYSIIKAVRTHKHLEYAMTNERIIVRDKYKLTSFYYRDLGRVRVTVGLIDKLFKVGDIKITKRSIDFDYSFDPHSPDRLNLTLLDIENPHAVGQKLQQFIDANQPSEDDEIMQDVEYESYYEDGRRGVFSKKFDIDDDDFYKDNDFEEKPKRYTSKKKSSPAQKTEEDDYLDNIMDSINKKDNFD